MKCLMEKFVSKEEADKYEKYTKKFDIVDDLMNKYKKNWKKKVYSVNKNNYVFNR